MEVALTLRLHKNYLQGLLEHFILLSPPKFLISYIGLRWGLTIRISNKIPGQLMMLLVIADIKVTLFTQVIMSQISHNERAWTIKPNLSGAV